MSGASSEASIGPAAVLSPAEEGVGRRPDLVLPVPRRMPSCPTCRKYYSSGRFCPVDGSPLSGGQADPTPATRTKGTEPGAAGPGLDDTPAADEDLGVVDRYRLLRLVGQGAMGAVYAAEHRYIGRLVALKLLQPRFAEHPEAVPRLQREAQAASAIGHPNIVRVEDFGISEDGQAFLALEWLEGETLQQRLERSKPQLAESLRIMKAICSALEAAHRAGIIHRDLKPANVFLVARDEAPPQVKLLDFGIAKVLDSDAARTLTAAGMFLGTPEYASPEQARGQHIDHRTDIYALGVLLYELLSGQVPFSGATAMEVLLAHIDEPPPPLSPPDAADLPPALEPALWRCLAKDPDERFSSVAELAQVLDEAEQQLWPPTDERALADRGGVAPAQNRWRPRLGLLGLAAAALLVVGAGLWWPTAAERPRERPPAAHRKKSPPAARGAASAPHAEHGDDHREPRQGKPFHAEGPDLALDATLQPTGDRVDRPVLIELQVRPKSASLGRQLAAGKLTASYALLYFKGHRKVVAGALPLPPDGRLRLEQTLLDKGKYHLAVTLFQGKHELARGRVDICRGADPDDPRALAQLCPGLNSPRSLHASPHRHGSHHHTHHH